MVESDSGNSLHPGGGKLFRQLSGFPVLLARKGTMFTRERVEVGSDARGRRMCLVLGKVHDMLIHSARGTFIRRVQEIFET